MSEVKIVPELTLDPTPAPAAPAVPQPAQEIAVPQAEQVVLSPEEEKMIADFIPKIDLHNSNLVLQYGAGAQQKIADFSQNVLDNVRTKDMGEVGEMLTNVVTEPEKL